MKLKHSAITEVFVRNKRFDMNWRGRILRDTKLFHLTRANLSTNVSKSKLIGKEASEITLHYSDFDNQFDFEGTLSNLIRPSYETQTPIVIRGLNKHTVAFRKWYDVEYLREKVGYETMCEVEIGSMYSNSQKSIIEFGQYCDYILLSAKEDKNNLPLVYLAQNEVFSSLRNDYYVPQFCQDNSLDIGNGSLDFEMIWFGPARCQSPLHFDPLDNLFMQFVGRKQFILFPQVTKDNNSCFYPGGGGQLNTSAIGDIEKVDLSIFPRFSEAPQPTIALLNPGDALFIPKKWWHHVKSLERSVSVNIFWK